MPSPSAMPHHRAAPRRPSCHSRSSSQITSRRKDRRVDVVVAGAAEVDAEPLADQQQRREQREIGAPQAPHHREEEQDTGHAEHRAGHAQAEEGRAEEAQADRRGQRMEARQLEPAGGEEVEALEQADGVEPDLGVVAVHLGGDRCQRPAEHHDGQDDDGDQRAALPRRQRRQLGGRRRGEDRPGGDAEHAQHPDHVGHVGAGVAVHQDGSDQAEADADGERNPHPRGPRHGRVLRPLAPDRRAARRQREQSRADGEGGHRRPRLPGDQHLSGPGRDQAADRQEQRHPVGGSAPGRPGAHGLTRERSMRRDRAMECVRGSQGRKDVSR